MDEAESLREFIRELLLRFDRKTEAWERVQERRHQEYMANFAELRERTREMYAEDRAQRQALLAIIDRLDSGGGTARA